ncbi:autotransporter assembly complex protein TamB [Gilliamella apis]|uniref:autotransporter assembly complex protein TamB n=1 Tax=Gilliamella apis TaxID=1970738 RepID=UPI0013FDD3AD|nr:translocation/assembly module TamB domain-containing protein [Gilliamella apis]
MIYTSLGVKLTTYVLNKFLPELKIAQVEGTFHDLHIKGLSLELPGVNVQVKDATFKLSGLCLIQTKICVKQFDADGVNVVINTNELQLSPDEPTSEKRRIIKTPLPIELKQTHISDVNVKVNDMQFGMSNFTGKANWVNEKIYVFPAVAMDLQAIFADHPAKNSNNKFEDDLALDQKIKQLFNQPLINSLPQVSIPLDINVTSLSGNNWLLHIAGQDYHFNQVNIKTEMINNHIMVKHVDTNATTPYVNGHAYLSGEITLGDNWPILASVKVDTEKNHLNGQFSGNLLGKLFTYTNIAGLNQITIEGQINFIEKYLPLITKLDGKHIQWPIEGDPQYQLDNFAISLNGNAQKYNMLAKGLIKGDGLPDTSVDIVGAGTNQSASFDHANIKFPQGDINLTGQLDWQTALKWDASINLNNVDIIKELPTFPIRLAGQLKTSGMLEGDLWQLNIPEIQLKGNIKQANFSANGDLFVDSNRTLSAKNLSLLWGKNQLNINGSTDKGNLNSQLNLTTLSLLVDNLSGTIIGNVKMTGSKTSPVIESNINIGNLTYENISIAKANLSGKIQYTDQLSGQLKLIGQNIDIANQSIKKANIELSGNEARHSLNINFEGSPLSMATSLNGQLDKQHNNWTASIPHSLLTLANNNRWQLAKPISLSYDLTNHVPTIGAHCWHSNNSSICLDKSLSIANNNQTSITLKDIDLAKLPIPNDGETKIDGFINGKADIKFDDTSKIPSIKANITSNRVYIKQMISNQALPIPFDLFNINAEFNEQQAKLNWRFGLNKLGRINGDLSINDPTGKKDLSGQLNIDNLALAIINPLLSKDEYANGAINGMVKFSGSLMDPSLTGGINLKHSDIKSNQLPIDIKSAMVDIKFNGKTSTMKGILATKSGNININGQASWNNFEKWQATLNVNGAAMDVSVPPMIVMSVIPDIKIEATQDELTILGKVSIPKGKITVDSLPPSSIDVSPDEVMLDRNHKQIQAQKFGMKINSHIEINIGDKVTVDAFGLQASLKGKLIATQTNKGLDLHGEILIPNGRFHAYGQDLIINKGIITFSGPTDQAMLDIEAIRNPDSMDNSNITAGIRVKGSSTDPKIEIFSDPAMSQQEALSYLIRGQGLDSSDQSDNDMMTAFLVGVGTAKTGQFIGDIGNAFGIKNLSLDTQGAGNNSKVVVSGYILPHLQLKYGVGIFDSLATFTLRYRLLPNLYVEAASGIAQTLDLIYQFEFN